MTDGPRKPKSPARFIAVGCTVVLALGVVIAVFAGIAFYKISRGMDDIAAVARDWLARQPEAEAGFGSIQRIEPVAGGRKLEVNEGKGWFDYAVTGAKASGRARVAVVRHEGEWRAVGARLTVGDRETAFGSPP